MLIAEDHTGWPKVTEDPRTRRAGLRQHLVRRVLPPPRSATPTWPAGRPGCSARPGSVTTGRWPSSSSPARCGGPSSTRSPTTSPTTRPATPAGSARTSMVAVNHAPLVGATRDFAEARCRVACGLSMLSAGTPDVLHGRGDRRPEALPRTTTSAKARRTCRASGPAPARGCSASTRTSSACDAPTGPSARVTSTSCTPPTPTASSPSPDETARARSWSWPASTTIPFSDGYVIRTDPDRLPVRTVAGDLQQRLSDLRRHQRREPRRRHPSRQRPAPSRAASQRLAGPPTPLARLPGIQRISSTSSEGRWEPSRELGNHRGDVAPTRSRPSAWWFAASGRSRQRWLRCNTGRPRPGRARLGGGRG